MRRGRVGVRWYHRPCLSWRPLTHSSTWLMAKWISTGCVRPRLITVIEGRQRCVGKQRSKIIFYILYMLYIIYSMFGIYCYPLLSRIFFNFCVPLTYRLLCRPAQTLNFLIYFPSSFFLAMNLLIFSYVFLEIWKIMAVNLNFWLFIVKHK